VAEEEETVAADAAADAADADAEEEAIDILVPEAASARKAYVQVWA
jgi:hypothetical protein